MSIGQFESTFETYDSIGVIGNGGSGRVFEVRDASGNIFAAKVLDAADRSSDKAKRFKNELTFCLTDRHPNVVRVLDHGLVKDGNTNKPFYLMKRYKGSLRELIREGVDPDVAVEYFAQLLDGAEAAHLCEVVHRDIKPENFLYDGTTLVLADFGIAAFAEEDLQTAVKTKDSQRLANFQYAAPEQRTPGEIVDRRADIYALGLILNELFTGEVPQGTRFKSIADAAPEYGYLDPLVDEMLSHDPKDRPPDISGVKSTLQTHKLEFVTQQRINELNKVVPVTDVSGDPLVADPPRLVDYDWTPEGVLTLILNRNVTPEWVEALRNMGSYTSVMGKDPGAFKFNGNVAVIGTEEKDVQAVINHFKEWLPRATAVYKQTREASEKRTEEKRLEALQRERTKEEARARVRRNVQI